MMTKYFLLHVIKEQLSLNHYNIYTIEKHQIVLLYTVNMILK